MSVKILHIDLETSPMQAWVWGLFKQNVSLSQIKHDWYLLTWAAKWHGKDTIMADALWLHKRSYRRNKKDDRMIVQSMWKLLNEADIVVAHNADRFDVAKINAKFFEYGMSPPRPFKTVDTLKVARRFGFSSKRLDYISKLKSFGQKLKTDFDLWVDVMAGDKKQCARMLDYNKQDVVLLEEVYTAFLPWITNHPNVALWDDSEVPACPKCGGTDLKKDGKSRLTAGVYQQYKCKSCGGWARGSTNLAPKSKREATRRNVAA